jgi:L-lactate dehydrogenase complex protein LldE
LATLTRSSSHNIPPRDVRLGLFMPCYLDLIYPRAGIATLELLEKFGLHVDYPLDQTCCGQPMSNSGDQLNARGAGSHHGS